MNYVVQDDLPQMASSPEMLAWFLKVMTEKFKTLTSGALDWFLGISVDYDREQGRLTFCQEGLIKDLVAKEGLQDEPPVPSVCSSKFAPQKPTESEWLSPAQQRAYMSIVGALNYIAKQTRFDIISVVSVLSQFLVHATLQLLLDAKRVIIYLRDSANEGITYWANTLMKNIAVAYCDASHAPGGLTGIGWRRSRTGIIIMMNGAAVMWLSKAQTCVTLSSCEAEYISLSNCCQEVVWIRGILEFLGCAAIGPTTVFEDNQAALTIANNSLDIKRSKAVDTRYHYTREKIEEGIVVIKDCSTDLMMADVTTKGLQGKKLHFFWSCGRGAVPTTD